MSQKIPLISITSCFYWSALSSIFLVSYEIVFGENTLSRIDEMTEAQSVLAYAFGFNNETGLSISGDSFVELYNLHKKEVWGKDPEGKIWSKMLPTIKSYENMEIAELVLSDINMSDYSGGLMFGWTPFVATSVDSKLPFVLGLAYFFKGSVGVQEFYEDTKKKTLAEASLKPAAFGASGPSDYSILTGVVCSLPKPEKRDDALVFAEISLDYFELIYKKFLADMDKGTGDATLLGLRDGLFEYYFFREGEAQAIGEGAAFRLHQDRKNTIYWPFKEQSFDIRAFYDELQAESKERRLTEREQKVVKRFANLIAILH